MTATRATAPVDPAALKHVLRYLRFGDAMAATGDLPDPIVTVLNSATTAYVQSQRDPAAFRAALERGMPTLLRAVDALIREELAFQIEHDERAFRDPKKMVSTGLSCERLTQELAWNRAVYAWLYPNRNQRVRGKSA